MNPENPSSASGSAASSAQRGRLRLVATALVVLLVLAAVTGLIFFMKDRKAEAFSRKAMLEEIARNCFRRAVNEFSAGAVRLASTTQDLVKKPGAETLSKAQRAWIDLHFIQKRNQMLFYGPVKDMAFWTAIFYPHTSSRTMETVSHGSKPIDQNFIELLGSSAKGFYAIEYLLFDLPQGSVKIGSETNGAARLSTKLLLEAENPLAERRRIYVAELAGNLDRHLQEAVKEVESKEFSDRFAGGNGDSIDLLVKQIVESIETGLHQPLKSYMDQFALGKLSYDKVEGMASETSLPGMKAIVEGVQSFYLCGQGGLGIQDYVRHANPDLAERLDQQFKDTIAAFDAIKLPLDKAFVTRWSSIVMLENECRKLERVFKTDVVSALGATVMFSTNDGD